MTSMIYEHFLELALGICTSMMGFAIKRMKKKIDEQESIKMGVQALLRDRLIQTYNYYVEKGYCPIYARDNIKALATEYYNLGGNGVVHTLMEKLDDLPTDIPKGV